MKNCDISKSCESCQGCEIGFSMDRKRKDTACAVSLGFSGCALPDNCDKEKVLNVEDKQMSVKQEVASMPVTEKKVKLISQKEYQNRVISVLSKKLRKKAYRREFTNNMERLMRVFMLNLETIYSELSSLYAEKSRGRKAIDPQIILRSFLLMKSLNETSVTEWVKELGDRKIFQLFCGIEHGNIPSVGTHYGFLDRLHSGEYRKSCGHYVPQSEMRKATRTETRVSTQKPSKEEWDFHIEEEEKKLEHLYKMIKEREDQPRARNMLNLLNEILHKVTVRESARLGIIDLSNLDLFGDGTIIQTASSADGKRICGCGDRDCEHPRLYSDPQSSFGWDGRLKKVVYGYRLFQLVSASNHHDLPIHLSLSPANAHEAGMAMLAIEHLRKMYKDLAPHAMLKYCAFDALYDIVVFYKFLHKYTQGYAIPYRTDPGKCVKLSDNHLFTPDGLPLCPGGKGMRRHGNDKRGRAAFACPAKCLARRDGGKIYVFHPNRCPQGADCEPSLKLGPLYYVSQDIDPRYFPSIPRGSQLFKDLQNARSSVERSNSTKKYQHQMSSARIRVLPHAFAYSCFISLLEHSRVWFFKIKQQWEDVISQKLPTKGSKRVLGRLKKKEQKNYENLILLLEMSRTSP